MNDVEHIIFACLRWKNKRSAESEDCNYCGLMADVKRTLLACPRRENNRVNLLKTREILFRIC